MTDDNHATIPPQSRLQRAGWALLANDYTRRTWLSPDGLRAVPFEQAIAELDKQEADK